MEFKTILLTLLLFFSCKKVGKNIVETQEQRTKIDPTVVRMVTDSWEPYCDKNMKGGGPLIAITREAFKRVGFKLEVDWKPWKRSLSEAYEGKYDAIACPYKNPEREKYLLYSKTVIGKAETIFMVKADSNIKYKTMDDLKKYSFGLLNGVSISDEFDKVNFNKVKVDDDLQSIKMLLKNKVDIIAGGKMVFLHKFRKHYPNKNTFEVLKTLGPVLKEGRMYHGFSRKVPRHKKIRDAFDKGMEIITKDGTVDRILNNYGLKE